MNQDLIQTFLLSMVLNTFADKDEKRTWPEKVARAALVSVPATIVINTSQAINSVGDKFPNLDINEQTPRPKTVQDLAAQVEEKASEARLRLAAYYTRPEDQWKNPKLDPTDLRTD